MKINFTPKTPPIKNCEYPYLMKGKEGSILLRLNNEFAVCIEDTKDEAFCSHPVLGLVGLFTQDEPGISGCGFKSEKDVQEFYSCVEGKITIEL
jgi:hypothetical protein